MRAVRRYQRSPVPHVFVEQWFEHARRCGSSKNSQPWRFAAVTDPQVLAVLAGCGDDGAFLADAPLGIAVAAVQGAFPFSTIFDLGRVSQAIMIAAWADGVGTCPVVLEPADRIEEARRALHVPSRCRLDLVIACGFPAKVPAGRLDRLPRETIRQFETFSQGQFSLEIPQGPRT